MWEGALHTKAVHHVDLILCGCRDEGRMVDAPCRLSLHSPVTETRWRPVPHSPTRSPQTKTRRRLLPADGLPIPEPKTMKNSDWQTPKMGTICAVPHIVFQTAVLRWFNPTWCHCFAPLHPAPLGSVWLFSARLGSGSLLLLCYPWTLPIAEPLFNTTPWNCVLEEWEGYRQWHRTMSAGLILTTSLMERGRQNVTLLVVHSLFLPPKTTPPVMMCHMVLSHAPSLHSEQIGVYAEIQSKMRIFKLISVCRHIKCLILC